MSLLMAQKGLSVAYIDTTNSFSAKRVYEMYWAREGETDSQHQKASLPPFLNRIHVFQVYDAFLLFNILEQIREMVTAKACSWSQSLRLIVIDSVSSVLAPILGGSQRVGHSLLAEVGRLLKELATVHHLTIIVTNVVIEKREAEQNRALSPGLGVYWAGVPHQRINLLQHPTQLQKRIFMSQTVPGLQAFLELWQGGFRSA